MSFPVDLQQLFQHDRVVAVLTAPDGETAEAACRALARGGLSCAEITFRTEAAAEAISRAALIEGFVVGAGTVLSAQQARLARDAGAAFAVAPGTNDEVVHACAELELPFVPGAATATEIDHARNLGCSVVKLFPAGSLGGPGFVKAMSAVYPDLRFVPTGGIDSTSLSAYLGLPSVLACGGSWLVDGRLLAERRFDEIERLAREAVVLQPMNLREKDACRWDLVALGEVMLRLDPGDRRIATTRTFDVCEGGGEYNVARALRRCFGQRTAVVTALADNPVGRLIEDLMLQGGVEPAHVGWIPYDGIGRDVRNGLNFTERGFGVRPALGCSDRANSAASKLRPGDVNWERIFGAEGARWFHCGGVFGALSEDTAALALEGMEAARGHGTIVSFDLNYRPSLWAASGGTERAAAVNAQLVAAVDVLLGNEEDLSAALGYQLEGVDEDLLALDVQAYEQLLQKVIADHPHLALVAITLRQAHTATVNDWGAVCHDRSGFHVGPQMQRLEIFDRVGGGDSFASGLVYGLLGDRDLDTALAYGVAHGALAMTTPGDVSMATLAEVEHLMAGGSARVQR